MQCDTRGRPLGTLREIASRFLTRLGGRDTVTLSYRHSLLGAELVAAGFVVASREYAVGAQADPFRLPRVLRAIAFEDRGHDLDDAASYPRACLDVFREGREESRLFLDGANRETIMAGVGSFYFGDSLGARERRKRVKELFNALDNDGTVAAWCCRAEVPPARRSTAVCVRLTDGRTFSLASYAASRDAVTAEFSRRMPAMQQFVADWLRAHDPARWPTRALTAKSYFLQEAEGLSRRAKAAWAARRGDARVVNLQHDGLIVMLPDGVAPTDAAEGMSAACEAILGYAQPVEVKTAGAAPAVQRPPAANEAAPPAQLPSPASVPAPPLAPHPHPSLAALVQRTLEGLWAGDSEVRLDVFLAALPPSAMAAGQAAVMAVLRDMEDAGDHLVRDGWIHLV